MLIQARSAVKPPLVQAKMIPAAVAYTLSLPLLLQPGLRPFEAHLLPYGR